MRKLERKVQAFTVAGVVSGLIIWALTSFIPAFETGVPQPLVTFLNWAVPIAVGLVSGYLAKHTERPGLAPRHKVVRPERRHAPPEPGADTM